MRHVRFAVVTTAVVAFLAAAAPAMAGGAGEGLAGETNDKAVTFFCFGVMAFFVATVFVGTIVQTTLEKRKDARKAAKMRQRAGW
jgi:hypothetical protein